MRVSTIDASFNVVEETEPICSRVVIISYVFTFTDNYI